MDIISDKTLDELERVANTPVVSHTEWVSLAWAEEHFGSLAEARFVAQATPNNVAQLINRLRVAEGKLKEFEELEHPPLTGRWHHGHGCVVSGTVRIAASDFDTEPSKEFQNQFWDWVCEAMNKLTHFKDRQRKEEENG